MPISPYKIAAVQLASGSNVNANLLETEKLVDQAARQGASLVVLPENFAFMGHACRELLDIQETPGDGPLQQFLADLARRKGIWLVGGTVPLTASTPDKVRAACLVLCPEGQVRARYDKMHLFDVKLAENGERYEESASIEPGEAPVVVDTPFGKLGLAICYELRFPELFRALIDRGAELFALPSAFTAITGKAHWQTLVRARAVENLAYIAAAAQGGFHVNGRETYGNSMVVDPWGAVLDCRERGNGVAMASIDPDFQQLTRRNFPCLSHRRLHCD